MSLSPQVLMSSVARERCIANIKELPGFFFNKEKPKHNASVLVPLCVQNGEVYLLYTLRSSNLKNHSGQVSFPGGKKDEGESVVETALRETEEEIGVSPEKIDVWCEMPQVQGRNKDMLITPVVGEIINFDPNALRRNFNEVDEIFTVPMKELCDVRNHAHLKYEKQPIPIFLCEKHKVWGITGLITHLFLQCFLPPEVYKGDFLRKRFALDELLPSKL
ncbi:PREDICTED: nucleoside diphosphate-linked moiety X motif 8, mitochondrial isoform X1 [Papilio xuthus]|uniref:Nucleoside diphosphate-linked moiety X motif 8, mitochondrial isoform X1 n=1 Tax=Papilio xuthus TaxID=66420 RepID=A0AAJ6ZV99_PAPXU|nr:PREDICTED: nucleoside diphosphate-linked moiety X motif 8, mitochondrial isoform X1 [Papilio xuthus]